MNDKKLGIVGKIDTPWNLDDISKEMQADIEKYAVRRKFLRPDGTTYINHVAKERLDECIEDLTIKQTVFRDYGMRVGQIWTKTEKGCLDTKKTSIIITNYNPKNHLVVAPFWFGSVKNIGECYCIPYSGEQDSLLLQGYVLEKTIELPKEVSKKFKRHYNDGN